MKTVQKAVIKLNSSEKLTLDSTLKSTYFDIIHTYPSKLLCGKSEKYSNLYICKNLSNGDTTWVFEECSTVSPYALDSISDFMAVLSEPIGKNIPKNSAIVFIPPNLKMPSFRKFVFGNVKFVIEN